MTHLFGSEALLTQARTGLTPAYVKAGYAIDGAKNGWVSSGLKMAALVETALPAAPGGAMGLTSAWMALLAALAYLLM